eukprot:ANDGO_06852.mRNA.1 Putative ATP-dependent helicase IRC3
MYLEEWDRNILETLKDEHSGWKCKSSLVEIVAITAVSMPEVPHAVTLGRLEELRTFYTPLEEDDWFVLLVDEIKHRLMAKESLGDDFFLSLRCARRISHVWKQEIDVSRLRGPQSEAVFAVHQHFQTDGFQAKSMQRLFILRYVMQCLVCRGTLNGSSLTSLNHKIESFARSNTPALVQLPVGMGKTGIAMTLPFGMSTGRVLFLAPNTEIAKEAVRNACVQSSKCFIKNRGILCDGSTFPRVGLIVGRSLGVDGRAEWESLGVVVADEHSLSTLNDCAFVVTTRFLMHADGAIMRRLPSNFFDLVIVDEAHHSACKTYRRIRSKFPGARYVYATATPNRADGRKMDARCVYFCPRSRAWEVGAWKRIIVDSVNLTRLVFPSMVPDGDVVEFSSSRNIQKAGHIRWVRRGIARSSVAVHQILGRVLKLLEEKNRPESTVHHQAILQAVDLSHAILLEKMFNDHSLNTRGFRAIAIGSTNPSESDLLQTHCEKRLKAFKRGRYDAIVHVGILGEGFDHCNLSICGIIHPFSTSAPLEQLIGRVIRTFPPDTPGLDPSVDNVAHVVTHAAFGLEAMIRGFATDSTVRTQFRGRRRWNADGTEVTPVLEEGYGLTSFSLELQ